MALTSSLYSGVSGLINMGNAMQVIGDNISNVNTTGFKAATATFQDIMAQSLNTARGGSQVGRGASMSDVAPLFTQGSFESTSSPTDLAIGGNGFFIVSNPNVENSQYFTRAGQFHIDQYGFLVNPAGLRVQGWEMETQPDGTAEIIGAIGDIQLSNSSSPVATSQATATVNLDSGVAGPTSTNDLTTDWLAVRGASLPGELAVNVHYEYKTTFNVYDSLGTTHEITVYFDRQDPTVAGQERQWEFLVTCNPEDDKGPAASAAEQGLLMRGTINFTSQGQIESFGTLEAYHYADGSPSAWHNATFGDHNYPQLTAFFLDPSGNGGGGNADSSAQLLEFNFGARAVDPTAATIVWNTEAITTTQYANRSSTLFYDQDGFGAGFLETLNVDSEGVISGSYSNGRIISLAQISLARFNSPTDLAREGGSLWRETTASGAPITGPPRTNGLGTIASNALEQSTVDMGTEFVRLITTQRAFQANSRVITTTDDMLNELLNMKR
ncbi:MAG TPA: flagellar hook protein FlgE [Thermodesulfobacteriaceae bacterium]|nr:flagellar hook protein FlgE [Thermodesulfobacteriaceae bacterium]